jgi:hypothetical protein
MRLGELRLVLTNISSGQTGRLFENAGAHSTERLSGQLLVRHITFLGRSAIPMPPTPTTRIPVADPRFSQRKSLGADTYTWK